MKLNIEDTQHKARNQQILKNGELLVFVIVHYHLQNTTTHVTSRDIPH